MTTLTPQQRIAAYEWAAERIAEDKNMPIMEAFPRPVILQDMWTGYPELDLFLGLDTKNYRSLEDHPYTQEARLFILGSCILMAEEEIERTQLNNK